MEQENVDNKLWNNDHKTENQIVLQIRLSNLVVLRNFCFLREKDNENQNNRGQKQ